MNLPCCQKPSNCLKIVENNYDTHTALSRVPRHDEYDVEYINLYARMILTQLIIMQVEIGYFEPPLVNLLEYLYSMNVIHQSHEIIFHLISETYKRFPDEMEFKRENIIKR